MRYLGQTKENPHEYLGSGIDWRQHISEYGNDIETYILFNSTNWEELKFWGKYYSNYYQVVSAQDDFGNKIWANRIPETGGGGPNWDEERKIRHKKSITAALNRPEIKKKLVENMNRPDVKERHKQAVRNGVNTSEAKERRKIVRSNPVAKEKHRAAVTKAMNSLDYILKVSGKNHHRYDHTIYEWINQNGIIEICTRQELKLKYGLNDGHLCNVVKGKRNSHKGWKILRSK